MSNPSQHIFENVKSACCHLSPFPQNKPSLSQHIWRATQGGWIILKKKKMSAVGLLSEGPGESPDCSRQCPLLSVF